MYYSIFMKIEEDTVSDIHLLHIHFSARSVLQS